MVPLQDVVVLQDEPLGLWEEVEVHGLLLAVMLRWPQPPHYPESSVHPQRIRLGHKVIVVSPEGPQTSHEAMEFASVRITQMLVHVHEIPE